MRIFKRIVIALAVIACLVVGAYYLFHIQEVKVEGTQYYSDAEIKKMVFQKKFSDNQLGLWFYEKITGFETLPFVETVQIENTGIGKVTLHVYDKTVSGCIKYMGQYVYFDKDGIVLQTLPEKKKDVLVVTGINFGTFSMGEAFKVQDEEVFQSIMNLSQLIAHYKVPVKRMHVDTSTFLLYSGNLQIYLGRKKMYDDEISNLSQVLKKASEEKLKLSGTIHMENYQKGDSIIVDTKTQDKTTTKAKDKKSEQ